MNNSLKWVWLTSCKGIGSSKITSLLDKFEGIDEIYSASGEEYKGITGISANDIKSLENKSLEEAEKIAERTETAGAYVLCYDDERYPENLKRLVNPPYVLYVKGNFDFTKNRVYVGVVGTRNYSDYGAAVTRRMSLDLASEGFTVVSGMARGIDTISAVSAMKVGAETLAVLGCGIDIVYPPENGKIMQAIAEHGAVISEYPPMTPPEGYHFPERNRIIAGLSDCLLVTEAPSKSGALITAKCAYDIGVEIYSVPGSVFSAGYVGSNNLIKAGAKIATHSRDIKDDFSPRLTNVEKPAGKHENSGTHLPEVPEKKQQKKRSASSVKKETPKQEQKKPFDINDIKYSGFDSSELLIIEAIGKSGTITNDEIIRQTELPTSKVNSLLPLIEIEGIIKKHAGNTYTLAEE